MGAFEKLYIPKPCHENWEQMSPEEKGRHCALCDKVVRDFSGMPKSEIISELSSADGKVCGRIPKSEIDALPFEAMAISRFPVERLRFFLLAFVLVFGLEALGVSHAEAQKTKPVIESLRKPQRLRSAVQDTSKEIQLKGRILDVYTQEPVPFVRVAVYEGDRLVKGVLSDTAGRFEFNLPKSDLHETTYDIKISHHGRERLDTGIGHDIKELLYLVDAAYSISGLEVMGSRSISLLGETSMGLMIMDPKTIAAYSISSRDRATLYRPLDEWLMMNHSEIHHSGRW
jgi:hypothetical protein